MDTLLFITTKVIVYSQFTPTRTKILSLPTPHQAKKIGNVQKLGRKNNNVLKVMNCPLPNLNNIKPLTPVLKHSNYSGILPQRHQDTKIIELFFIIAFLMHGTLKLMRKLRYSIYIHLLFGSLCLGG